MGAKKHFLQIFLVFVLAFSFAVSSAVSVRANPEIELPVNKMPSVSACAEEGTVYLAPYIRYAHNLPAKDAKSALSQRDKFLPYDVLSLKKDLGTYWFLISFDKIKDKNIPTAYLDLGNFLPKNSHVLVYSNSSKRWQVLEDVYTTERKSHEDSFDVENKNSVNIFHSGLYDLTSLRDGGELLIYSPGVPSIWFAPKLLSPAKAPLTLDKRLTPLLLLAIFVLMVFVFWRGAKEEGDARIWASFLALAVIVQFAWGVPQNVGGKLDLLDMVGVVASCLAIFFLPHIGRHLMVTEKKSPHFDSLLQFLAIPAIFPLIVLFVPIPEYLYIIRFAPLWGLYALVLFVLTIPLVLSGRKGAKLYAFFCLALGLGCLGALALRHDSEWYFLNYLGVFAAMITIFLAPRQTEKNIFDEKLSHEDIISAFAENNTIMRDALYRVELKLRDPFDRIMREACFLDFDLKTEDLADSLALLNDKKAGDVVERHTRNAIEDISGRTERMQGHADSLVLACRDLSGMLGHITELAQKEPVHSDVHELFNVKDLITKACDDIRAEAQDRQIGLGWYIAPNIGLHYRGDKTNLELVLSLLLRDAVRATEKGMISVRVRRANSPNPGHIVFTISDSGKGRPPVQRSMLTLLRAWELSSSCNGEVELRSSPGGLSFSFSLQCLAMDQNGEKPLSYASLDDIVLSHGERAFAGKTAGLSGGNIVFGKENGENAEEKTVQHAAGSQKDTGILIISPLAIQRQNFVYYLNKYETWEALDVDSALAFYEKKPASLVIVHSALSAGGCSAVLAGIRLLEDSLGIAHAPCIGLYQSAKDMEFLRRAGCNHTLPDNIGREDLCTAVAEILGDKNIQPITDIDEPHAVVKNIDKNVQKAVEKRLHGSRVHAGSVVDNAVMDFGQGRFSAEEKAGGSELPDLTKTSEETLPELYAERTDFTPKETKSGQASVLAAKEEKTGVFSKFMQSLKPKPQTQVQIEQDIFDDGVGEPMPVPKKAVSDEAEAVRNVSESEAGAEDNPVLPDSVQEAHWKQDAEHIVFAKEDSEYVQKDAAAENEKDSAVPAETEQAEHAVLEQEAEFLSFDGEDKGLPSDRGQDVLPDYAEQGGPLSYGLSFEQPFEQPSEQAEEQPELVLDESLPNRTADENSDEDKTVSADMPNLSFEADGVNAADTAVQADSADMVPNGNDTETTAESDSGLQKDEAHTVPHKAENSSLHFLPVENGYTANPDEDLPPLGVQNAVDAAELAEEISEQSVFVQSGLVALQKEEAVSSDNMDGKTGSEDSAGEGEFYGLPSEKTVPQSSQAGLDIELSELAPDGNTVQDDGLAENAPVLAHEPAIIDLSHDMLVTRQEEHFEKLVLGETEENDSAGKSKKKPRRRKKEKEEKVGLDIMLDYSVKSRQAEAKENGAEHDDRLVQLSFFPVNNENKPDSDINLK